ncbi:flagellar export protein FliJ, partial [candidate division KSB1 bacterium]
MNRYRFKLKKVLDVKDIYKELRRRDLKNSLLRLSKEENVLKDLKEELRISQNEVKLKRKKLLSCFELSFYYSYFNFLSTLIDIQVKKIERVKKDVENKRKKLIEASKEKEIIEKLKEKSWEAYLAEFQ